MTDAGTANDDANSSGRSSGSSSDSSHQLMPTPHATPSTSPHPSTPQAIASVFTSSNIGFMPTARSRTGSGSGSGSGSGGGSGIGGTSVFTPLRGSPALPVPGPAHTSRRKGDGGEGEEGGEGIFETFTL
jgi:hypothetical protein